MSGRRKQVTLTFAVKMKIPPQHTDEDIRKRIIEGILIGSSIPIVKEDFTVTIVKKEISYGKC